MPLAKINGQDIYYEDSGGTGPPVIFMHGFLMDQSLFDAQVAELSPDYRCVRWDARCFGRTQWDEKPFTLYDSAKDCLGLMDFLDISKGVLVGMSQGGYCALRAALIAPHRVEGLVLMSTRCSTDEEKAKSAYRQMRDVWQKMGPVPSLIEGLASAIIGPREEPGMEFYWDYWLPKWKQLLPAAIFHAMNNLIERDEITHRLQEVLCPVLITHGTNDKVFPVSLAEELCRLLPNCKGIILAPGAHAANQTHAQFINPSLKKFLECTLLH